MESNKETGLIWTTIGCLLILLAVSIFTYTKHEIRVAGVLPEQHLQTLTNASTTSNAIAAATTSDSNIIVLSAESATVRLDSLGTNKLYFIKSADKADEHGDTIYGGPDVNYSYHVPIAIGHIDPTTGVYSEYLRTETSAPLSLPGGDLLVTTATRTFSVWSKEKRSFTRSFDIDVPLVPHTDNCGEGSPLEEPLVSPDGKMFAVLSAVRCGYDYPQTLFVGNIESGVVSFYRVPKGGAVFSGEIMHRGKWNNQNFISFPAGSAKDCSGWPDGARFYLAQRKFVQGEEVPDGYASPDGKKIIVPKISTLPFRRLDDSMCEEKIYGGLSIKNGSESQMVFNKTLEPVGVESFRWLSNSLLMFFATTYEYGTSTVHGDDGKDKIVPDAGAQLGKEYYLYNIEADKLFKATTTTALFDVLRTHGFMVNTYVIKALDYNKYDVTGWNFIRENFIEVNGKMTALPGGELRFLETANSFEFVDENSAGRSKKDCSKEDCKDFFKTTRTIREIGQ